MLVVGLSLSTGRVSLHNKTYAKKARSLLIASGSWGSTPRASHAPVRAHAQQPRIRVVQCKPEHNSITPRTVVVLVLVRPVLAAASCCPSSCIAEPIEPTWKVESFENVSSTNGRFFVCGLRSAAAHVWISPPASETQIEPRTGFDGKLYRTNLELPLIESRRRVGSGERSVTLTEN